MNHTVPENSGIVDEDINFTEVIDAGLNDVFSTSSSSYRIIVNYSLAAICLNLCFNFIGGTVRVTTAIKFYSGVVDNNLRPLFGKGKGKYSTETPSGTCNYCCFSIQYIANDKFSF